MLFKCVTDFVDPKIKNVSRDIGRLQKDLSEGGAARQRDELDALMDFNQELEDFKSDILRVTNLPYKPNLNDGVQISAAPLWKLFRHRQWQNRLKETWAKLEAEEYDWAHLAYSIWPDRVREKCKTDKSLAIAHDLEDLYEEPPEKPKKKRAARKKKAVTEEMDL